MPFLSSGATCDHSYVKGNKAGLRCSVRPKFGKKFCSVHVKCNKEKVFSKNPNIRNNTNWYPKVFTEKSIATTRTEYQLPVRRNLGLFGPPAVPSKNNSEAHVTFGYFSNHTIMHEILSEQLTPRSLYFGKIFNKSAVQTVIPNFRLISLPLRTDKFIK